ncbi:MAG: hypothetical protein GY869_12370 [Planctomycetes bacterium]|nr:hypothetical protein [Planctomycetota bacterium]
MMLNKFCRSVILVLIVFLGLACSQTNQAPSPPAHWYKGNLHTHSFWSDGQQFPEMVAHIYQQLGYQFLALSEHNSISEGTKWIDINKDDIRRDAYQIYRANFPDTWVEIRRQDDKTLVRVKPFNEYRHVVEKPGEFLMIPTEEITHNLAHFNLVNCVELIKPVDGATAIEVLQKNIDIAVQQQQQTGQAMLVHINHPNWRWMLTAEDLMVQEGVGFFEVYNAGGTSNNTFGDEIRPSQERMWDIILTKRLAELDLPIMYGIATDDTHNYTGSGPDLALPGRCWTMVRADHLTPESIVKAMKAGDLYASSGVDLDDIQFDGATLKIEIKTKPGVSYTTEFIGTLQGYDPTSQPVLDENGEPYLDTDGNPLRITRTYSDDIGRIFKTVKGSRASYTMTGDEIYVRATVRSDRLKPNYHVEGEYEVAWIQPVIPKNE